MNMFKDSSSLSDSYLLQLFNLQRENVESIDLVHKSDGLYATIKLVKEPQVCPVCQFKTTTVKDYTTKKIIHSLTTQLDVINVLFVIRLFMNIILLPTKI